MFRGSDRQALKEFEKWSKEYDHVGFFQRNLFIPTHEHIIAEMEKLEKPDSTFTLLDIGCGTGTLLMRLHAKFPRAKMHGIDIARGMIEVATGKAAGNPQLNFQVGNACQGLPYPNAHFEYLTCCHSFHHYPDQHAALREFRRVLKPGGKLFFVDSDVNRIWGWIMHWVIIGIYERFRVHHLRIAEVKEYFEAAGLRIERHERCGWKVPWMMTVATPST